MIKEDEIRSVSAARLKAARIAVQPNLELFAEQYNIVPVTLRSYEKGRSPLPRELAQRLSKPLGESVNYLLGNDLLEREPSATNTLTRDELPVSLIPIHGAAAAGLWMEGEDLSFDRDDVSIAAVSGYPVEAQYARRVVGNSVSKRIKDGEYAIFVKYEAFGSRLRPGMLVDCRRERAGLCEHTIKVFDGDRLLTCSEELENQVELPLAHEDDGTVVTIDGVVIWKGGPML